MRCQLPQGYDGPVRHAVDAVLPAALAASLDMHQLPPPTTMNSTYVLHVAARAARLAMGLGDHEAVRSPMDWAPFDL